MQDSERAQEAKCGLCGEPMPEGEEMFKFHGYSGGCPKPPLAEVAKYLGSMLAVDPPPSGASPQATGGYIHHSLTDWIPTPECDCDRCTSARKSAPKPTGGASPQAETSEDEDDAPAVDSWSAPLRKPVVPKILSTDDFYALLRIIEVLPVADPFLTDLQSKLSAEERRQHGNRASHLSGPEFVREIERIEALIQSRLPAPVSPVEPEPPTLEPCAHELDYHNCAECVGPKVEPEPCVWREDEDGIWETSCGASWVFTDGSPSENNTKFCHNCGHPVQPVAYVERFEDDEDEAGAPLKVEREP